MDGINSEFIDEVGKALALACVVGLVVILGGFWLIEKIGQWWNGPRSKK
jgi:Na+-driven multidrug efflux pump